MRTRKLRRGGQNKPRFKPAKTQAQQTLLKVEQGKNRRTEKLIRKTKERKNDPTQGRRAELMRTLTPDVEAADRIDTCADISQNRVMNYHLWADMVHDHGSNLKDIARPLFGEFPEREMSSNEDNVVYYFKLKFPAIQNKVRIRNAISFSIENKTELFPGEGPAAFRPFDDTPNSNVGVLQDAGFLLFRAMGAQNVITFGSVLDQAGKPCGKNDNPIAYIPDTRLTLDIRPCTYGFNEGSVRNIKIGRFIAGLNATCKFDYVFNRELHTGGTPDAGLQINKLGGDFKSIAEIAATGPDMDRFAGYIGKALGDISLVASLQETIGGTVNVFYPGGRDMTYVREPARTPKPVITKLILNTGDRLNHIRAYAFGVGSVYSSSSGGFRTFEYIPGVSDESSPYGQFRINLTRIKLLIETVDKTYESLILHIISIRNSGDFLSHSMKAGLPLISNPSYFIRAQQTLDNMVYILEAFRTYVLYHFMTQYVKYETRIQNIAASPITPEEVQPIKDSYEMLLKITDTVRPAAVSTKNSGGRDILNIISILKTTNLGIFDFEITNDIAQREGTISKRLLDRYMEILRSDRQAVPFNAYPVRKNGEMKGSQTFYVTNIYQLIGKNARIGEPYSNIFNTFSFGGAVLNTTVDGVITGGQATVDIFAQIFGPPTHPLNPIDEPVIPADIDIDILNDYRASGLTASDAFNAYLTYKAYPPSIIDPQLLQQVLLAYYNSTGVDGDTDLNYDFVKKPDYSDAISTKESLMFNVWSLYYNATIARSRDETFECEDNELSEYLIGAAESIRSLYGGDVPLPNIGYVDSPQPSVESVSESTMAAPGDEPLPASYENPIKLQGYKPSITPYEHSVTAPGDEPLQHSSFGKPNLYNQSFSMPVQTAGQRVARANWNIDLTKSFVRSVGASPS